MKAVRFCASTGLARQHSRSVGAEERTIMLTSPSDVTRSADVLQTIVWVAIALFAAAALLAAPARSDVLKTNDAVVTGFSGVKAAEATPSEGRSQRRGLHRRRRRLHADLAARARRAARGPADFGSCRIQGQRARRRPGVRHRPRRRRAISVSTKSTPNIYLGATSAFGLQIVLPDSDGDGRPERVQNGHANAEWMPGQFGPGGGPGSLWKVDGETGEISLFTTIAANTGAAIGDLVYDPSTRQFFASDLDTGLIYRLAAGMASSYRYLRPRRHRAPGDEPRSRVADDGSAMSITDPGVQHRGTPASSGHHPARAHGLGPRRPGRPPLLFRR